MTGMANVLLCFRKYETIIHIKDLMTSSGFNVLDYAMSGNEALRKIRRYNPELVVMGYEFNDMSAYEILEIFREDDACSFLVIGNSIQSEYLNPFISKENIRILIKPIAKYSFIQSVVSLINSTRKIKKLKSKILKLEKDMQNRKVVEKAKGILMDTLKISENDAHRMIQKKSMDTSTSMVNIAKRIIADSI